MLGKIFWDIYIKALSETVLDQFWGQLSKPRRDGAPGLVSHRGGGGVGTQYLDRSEFICTCLHITRQIAMEVFSVLRVRRC